MVISRTRWTLEYIAKVNLDALYILSDAWKSLDNAAEGKQKDGKTKDPSPEQIKMLQAVVNKKR